MSALIQQPTVQPSASLPRSTETIADLLHRLGDVPANRVRLCPFPGTATEQDVLDIDAHEDRLFELVDGLLVEKTMGFWESYLASLIVTELNIWVRSRNLGIVTVADGMMRLLPKQVRMPDAAFITLDRFPGGKPTPGPVPEISPNLAVEVISESNSQREIERKRKEYFKSGTLLVWEVDPRQRIVAVYTAT